VAAWSSVKITLVANFDKFVMRGLQKLILWENHRSLVFISVATQAVERSLLRGLGSEFEFLNAIPILSIYF
jgi:hypothetical protein